MVHIYTIFSLYEISSYHFENSSKLKTDAAGFWRRYWGILAVGLIQCRVRCNSNRGPSSGWKHAGWNKQTCAEFSTARRTYNVHNRSSWGASQGEYEVWNRICILRGDSALGQRANGYLVHRSCVPFFWDRYKCHFCVMSLKHGIYVLKHDWNPQCVNA